MELSVLEGKKMETKRGYQGSLKDSRKQKIRNEKIPSIYTGMGLKTDLFRPSPILQGGHG
jgi:hypothetical protein